MTHRAGPQRAATVWPYPRRNIGAVATDQIIDQLAADLTLVVLGAIIGTTIGVALFALSGRRRERAQWPR